LDEDHKRRTKPSDAPYRLKWSEPLFDSPFEKRRLRFLNSLLLAFSKAGMKCWIGDEDGRSTGVTVGSQQVYFMLDHPSAKRDRDNRFRTRPGKVDTLRYDLAGGSRVWVDTADDKLEDHLTEIVVQTITEGERHLRESAQRTFDLTQERRREMEELLLKRREEAERQRREAALAAERARQKGLLRMAKDRRHARDILELIAAVREEHGGATLPPDMETWVTWASGVADRLDPLKRIQFSEGGIADVRPAELPSDP
jgi:DNA-binding FrmR family transcriptional regulator